MEEERGLDQAAAVADMRVSFIHRVCEATVIKPKESREHARSVKIDRVLTGQIYGNPCIRMYNGTCILAYLRSYRLVSFRFA